MPRPNESDNRDPLRAAFGDYERAPRDIVPKTPWPTNQNADLAELDSKTVEVSYIEMNGDKVTRYTERTIVRRPQYRKDDHHE